MPGYSDEPGPFQLSDGNKHQYSHVENGSKILQKVLNGVEVRMKNAADLKVGTENRISQLSDQYSNGLRVL